MEQERLLGKVQTVLGLIDADNLGVTLPHEHLITDLSAYFVEPTEASERSLAYEPVRLDNLSWIKVHHMKNLDNLKLTDEKLAVKEALLYKWAGGNTIVEVSSIGLHRDPLALARISRATGLNVVMGTGYYIGLSHPPEIATRSEEEITENLVQDIMVGVGDTGVHAGVIGEIGCEIPLTEGERKVLRASAAAQQRTGAAINIHPSRSNELVPDIIGTLNDAGADLSRVVISHCDNFGLNRTTYRRLLEAGCYVEFDTFGHPTTPLPASFIPDGGILRTPGDVWRIYEIKYLIDEGYLNQILISHDVCLKCCYVTYGGHGYAHILCNVVPWMRRAGISDEQIHTLMVDNPKRLFQFTNIK